MVNLIVVSLNSFCLACKTLFNLTIQTQTCQMNYKKNPLISMNGNLMSFKQVSFSSFIDFPDKNTFYIFSFTLLKTMKIYVICSFLTMLMFIVTTKL